MSIRVRVPTEVTEASDALEMELQAVVSHMGAGDQPQFLWKGSKHSVSWTICPALWKFVCVCVFRRLCVSVCAYTSGWGVPCSCVDFRNGTQFTRPSHWSRDMVLFFNEWVFFQIPFLYIFSCVFPVLIMTICYWFINKLSWNDSSEILIQSPKAINAIYCSLIMSYKCWDQVFYFLPFKILSTYLCLLGDRVSLWTPGWPRTHRDLPASQELGFKVWATILFLLVLV